MRSINPVSYTHLDVYKRQIQYFTEDNTKMSIRPSGTEPKIKFYIEVKGYAKTREELEQAERKADEKINEIREELGI